MDRLNPILSHEVIFKSPNRTILTLEGLEFSQVLSLYFIETVLIKISTIRTSANRQN